ncbi:TPA: tyrosine-type recombinase/integrase [Enterobacter hormaechei]|uniref:tyrosine-type recombinase/integrase n=1 Tax=Enterobacter cloacae complex TaxID=354276 RepID=UPI0010BF5462|nr:integrase arm-type DNA-binding domain-containing protein [Enterobacter hormaechei]MCE1568536.1 tyrosine-type recombinase/integrase [Enterobacter hormaechei]MCM7249768.1 tyrosine-type recombinase/integrase [Enterobacter hormaechei]MCM7313190.1 tyrosine-type recombinase/integrase [Enterobacter hormaechei]MCM8175645.1 tyrosine-type recombinase/integrase [Enterobacter hormaechei]MEB7372085.1 tyrosine-type recombinase/integrase [Enterobacter hormaechei]
MPLTNVEIKNAQPRDKEYVMSDGLGLVVLVKPSGAKLWRYRYSLNNKKQKLSLGSYPEISLAQARVRAADARARVAQGISPVTERREKREASKVINSFEGVCLEWQSTRKATWSEVYADDTKRLFERNVFPLLGKRPIGEIEPLELLGLLRKIEDRGANELATKVRRRCGEVYAYAIVTGRAKYNPARDLATAMQRFQRGHYASLDASELPAFLTALETTSGNIMVNFAVRLLMLTGLRPGELRKGEWREIDLDNALWEIPAERMKARRPHLVPLSSQAIELLRSVHAISGSYGLMFPGRNDVTRHMSNMAMNQLISRCGYGERLTGHGFRHMMSTILHEQGFNSAWIELQLAHVDKNTIRGTYNRAQYLEGRREMMQWYSDYILSNATYRPNLHSAW